MLEFEDTRSEINFKRTNSSESSPIKFMIRDDLPRYSWFLNSTKYLENSDHNIYNHIYWILSQIKSIFSLNSAREKGAEFNLDFYWGSPGTGGGPIISSEVSALLLQYKINLNIGFYYENV